MDNPTVSPIWEKGQIWQTQGKKSSCKAWDWNLELLTPNGYECNSEVIKKALEMAEISGAEIKFIVTQKRQ